MKPLQSLLFHLVLGWLLLATPAGAVAQTLHLIVFCDTDDNRLMLPASQSYSFFCRELPERVAAHTGMDVQTYAYEKSRFTASNLDHVLTTLQVASDDVIFFWYDGHGYNDASGQWPTLSLPNLNNTRSLRAVYNTLNNKGARLLVVMANACNRERATPANISMRNHIVQNAPYDNELSMRYRDLFLHSRGQLLVTSSKRGEASSSGQSGAFFFLAFRESLDNMMVPAYTGTVNWNTLVDRIASRTAAIASDNGYDQHPALEISIASGGQQTTEQQAWNTASNTNTLRAYERYLSSYASGPHAAIANSRASNFRTQIAALENSADKLARENYPQFASDKRTEANALRGD